MVFEIGTATSTFDLYNKLRDFMATVNGWQMWSNIDGYDGYDTVYYSKGSTGYNNIYIRFVTRLIEPFLYGEDQYDYGNGDTGYINCFVYGHYPKDGDAYAGSTQLGSYGPRFYYFEGDGASNTWYQHILSQQTGGTQQGSEDVGNGDFGSATSRARRRWQRVNDSSANTGNEHLCFDGKRFFYYSSGNIMRRWTIERNHGNLGGQDLPGGSPGIGITPTDGFGLIGVVFAEDRSTRKQYIYFGNTNQTASGLGPFSRVRIDGQNYVTESLAAPTWPSRPFGAGTSAQNGRMIWDGGNFVYFFRGGGSTSGFTPDWGVYDQRTGTWETTTGSLPELPFNLGGFQAATPGFLSKTVSGFSRNRIYHASAIPLGIYYIELDDDTGLNVGGWQLQSLELAIPSTQSNMHTIFSRGNVHYTFPQNSTLRSLDDINAAPRQGGIFYSNVKETNWKQIFLDDSYTPQGHGDSRNFYVDGYVGRVRTGIRGETTDYIFVGNEDRVIVATNSDNQWTASYLGAFISDFGNIPYAELSEPVTRGVSKKIKLKNVRGNFQPNTNYTILDLNKQAPFKSFFLTNVPKRFMNGEAVTVTHVEEDYVIASVNFDYAEGAAIGIDPQPVGIWFADLMKFQLTNIFPIFFDDPGCCDDPSVQTFSILTDDDIVNASIKNTRNLEFFAFPSLIATADREGGFAGAEIRGQMDGVFILPSDSELQPGNIISIGNKPYYILELPLQTIKYAIGPLE